MEIPYVDLGDQHQAIKDELLEAIGKVMDHGLFVFGEEVQAFEEQFARLCGTRYAVGVNSGTDALILALRALEVGPGDEVITAPNSFVASASSIAVVGAKPVFVDVRDDYNLDPEKIEPAITANTRAIVPVHLTGRPAEMDAINEIAGAHGLHVIEDAAQAVLAEYGGRRAGALGKLGCFSLHPLKTLNACGDGGVVTTDDGELCERIRTLRHLGLQSRDDCVSWSSNSRLDSIQAAVLLVKMNYLEGWVASRRKNAALYRESLKDVPGLQLPVPDRSHESSAWHTFVVQSEQRDGLKQYLADNGIGTAVHYPVPIHLHRVAHGLGHGPGDFPVAEEQAARILSLPVHQDLGPAQLERIMQVVKTFHEQ